MSGMKNGHFPELCKIIEKSNNLLLLYSTSHIGDIFSSYSEDENQKKIIEEDLEFITKLTNDLCAFTYKDKMFIDYTSPKELLKERIESASLFDDFSIDILFGKMSFHKVAICIESMSIGISVSDFLSFLK